METIIDNWVPLVLALIGLAEVVVRLTPTEKDNTILQKIKEFINIFLPNRKKGGGKFK